MSVSSHLVETEADLAIKATAWKATEREVMGFAQRYASEHKVGHGKPSDAQDDIAHVAAEKGYPKSVIREAGNLMRRIAAAKPETQPELKGKLRALLRGYAHNIGLGKAFK